ncbi:MAG: hypothetical protein ACPLXM_12640 [Bacteroidales bacterium]
MKTLVIHPEDPTTDSLGTIYKNKGFAIIREWSVSLQELYPLVALHDRIIFLGHGFAFGLMKYSRQLRDKAFQELLRSKICFCIWCYADMYVEKVGLKGFYTGMFISEMMEAELNLIHATREEIDHSNHLFASVMAECLDSPNLLTELKSRYCGDSEVIRFNRERLYYRDKLPCD